MRYGLGRVHRFSKVPTRALSLSPLDGKTVLKQNRTFGRNVGMAVVSSELLFRNETHSESLVMNGGVETSTVLRR